MATAVPPPIALPAAQPTEILVASDEDSNSESENGAAASAPDDAPAEPPATRPAYVYTRRQLIYLYKSPLVIDPPDMPAMKYWFGDWEQQVGSKKESESVASPSNGRERRFRRDAEEGDTSRTSFRSALSQPSQMGNFKHQPLRSGDREARERERDQRDKDAQDKLRSLSDKYDRDRLSMSASSSARGGKERELAPHLQTASSRSSAATNGSSGRGERREPREPGKRRVGESDDWRRAGDRGRDENPDDRDDRERPRSKARNGSRTRRDTSTTRRDKDRGEDREREPERDRGERGDRRRGDRDRDRDDRRKDRDETARRPRDGERERGDDDDRHWRDDGKRDERLATRRDRDHDRDRNRDRGGDKDRDRDWERAGERGGERGDRWPRSDRARDDDAPSRRDRDKDRWDTEDREAKPKRGARGDRRNGGGGDDKDDRKDREKDKTPAWMETYVPNAPGAGILGGKGDDGELDELQAWKKTMKDRELAASGPKADAAESTKSTTNAQASEPSSKPLDEIEQFKLMMRQSQPSAETTPAATTKPPLAELPSQAPPAAPPGIRAVPAIVLADPAIAEVSSQSSLGSITSSSAASQATSATSTTSNPLLAMLAPDGGASSYPAYGASLNDVKPAVSRMFPTQQAQPPSEDPAFILGRAPGALGNAPAGSRLASLGRGLGGAPPSKPPQGFPPNAAAPPGLEYSYSGGSNAASQPPMSQMQDDFTRLGLDTSGMRDRLVSDHMHGLGQPHGMQQSLMNRHPDHNAFSPPADNRGFMADHLADMSIGMGPMSGAGVDGGHAAPTKGSRFAKLWENDGRRGHGPGPGLSPGGMQGPGDLSAFGGAPMSRDMEMNQFGGRGESNLNDMNHLYTMLSNSTQPSRGPGPQGQHVPPANPNSFPVNYPGHLSMQQQQQQQRFPPASRQELHHGLAQVREDRHFLADGMVPGLRNGPGVGRQNFYNEQYDDGMTISSQRLPPAGRGLDQLIPGQLQSGTSMGPNRNAGMQQAMYGRGPSPQQISAQRMPAGLSHLGSRPPHDPGQFMGMGGHQQPPFAGMGAASGFGGGHPQMRGGPPPLQGGPGGMLDMRSQSQMLGGGGGMPGGARASGFGMQPPPHGMGMPGGARQMQPPYSAQMGAAGGMLPPQMSSPPTGQDSHTLMALLLGNRANDGQMR